MSHEHEAPRPDAKADKQSIDPELLAAQKCIDALIIFAPSQRERILDYLFDRFRILQ